MPEVGEYWYDAHGSAEVVRIVEADDEDCTFLVVNSIVRPPFGTDDERLVESDVEAFLHEYQTTPDISDEWLDAGSTWFDRRDASSRVVLEEDVNDGDGNVVTFRTVRENGAGPVQRVPRAQFTELYVRIHDDHHELLSPDRFWVLGNDIRAIFMSYADAEAFVVEASALLALSAGSLQVVRLEHPRVPPFVEAQTLIGGGRGSSRGMSGVSNGIANGGPGTPGGGGLMMVSTFGTGGNGGMPPKPPIPECQTLWERLTDTED